MSFTIPGPFTNQTPFHAMHVWQWAKAQPRAKVTIHDYLAALGFIVGTDRLTEEDYRTLDHVIEAFHRVAPHISEPLTFADAFAAGGTYYVQGMEGRFTPSARILAALVAAGWIYEPAPENTYFQIVNGMLWAKYQQIIGSRCLAELAQ